VVCVRSEQEIQAARTARPAPREVAGVEYMGATGVVEQMAHLRTSLALAYAENAQLRAELEHFRNGK